MADKFCLIAYDQMQPQGTPSFKFQTNSTTYIGIVIDNSSCQQIWGSSFLDILADLPLASWCRLSETLCIVALWSMYRAKSCTSVFLAANFLFASSDTFAIGCIVQPQIAQKKMNQRKAASGYSHCSDVGLYALWSIYDRCYLHKAHGTV